MEAGFPFFMCPEKKNRPVMPFYSFQISKKILYVGFAEETSAAAEELSEQASQVRQMLAHFKLQKQTASDARKQFKPNLLPKNFTNNIIKPPNKQNDPIISLDDVK